jgi:hypothetical protein
MKKYMVSDLVKDLRSDLIDRYTRDYNILERDLNTVDRTVNDLAEEYFGSDIFHMNMAELEKPFQMFKLIRDYQITSKEAFYLVDNWDNESDWKQVMEAAEAFGVGIEDISDDEVEGLNLIWDLGGSRGNKTYSTIDSSIGKVYIYYSLIYGYSLLIKFKEGNPANYPISREEAIRISNSDSFGKYYSDNIRDNDQYSDLEGAWGCVGLDPDNPKRLMTSEDKAKLPKDLQSEL